MAGIQKLQLHEAGRLIDSRFNIEVTGSNNFEVVQESSGGSSRVGHPRNSEYKLGLTELLRRCTTVAATLDDGLVVSQKALTLPVDERRIHPSPPFTYPIELKSVDNFSALANALTTPQSRIASAVERGGNPRKRILLRFTSNTSHLSLDRIVEALDARSAG